MESFHTFPGTASERGVCGHPVAHLGAPCTTGDPAYLPGDDAVFQACGLTPKPAALVAAGRGGRGAWRWERCDQRLLREAAGRLESELNSSSLREPTRKHKPRILTVQVLQDTPCRGNKPPETFVL